MEIHSPDGDYLESIGYEIQTKIQEEQTTRLQEQIVLPQSLCEKITQEWSCLRRQLRDFLFRTEGLLVRGGISRAAFWPPYCK